ETQPVANQSESTASAGTDQQLTTTPQFLSETPGTQPVANQSESTASAGTDQQLTTTPQFLSETPVTQRFGSDEHLTSVARFDSEIPVDANKFIAHYDPNSTLDAYVDSYFEVVNDKFFMIELHTYRDPKNAEETIKTEILRLERLYQRKWEKEFLETISAEDKSLVNLANYEYRKALEDDDAFQHNVFANYGRYHQLKMHISKKWE
ncbi:unnamed protein product, partial [Trichobilharzia szidati]